MKASEEIGLLLKGVKREEIAALKEKEAAELKEAEEAAAKKAAEEAAKKAEEGKEEISSLETAKGLIEDLENKLQAKEDELAKLNKQFAELNNKQTVKEEPEKYTGTEVFSELFKSKKEESK